MQATPSGLRLLLPATRPNRPRGLPYLASEVAEEDDSVGGSAPGALPSQPFSRCCLSSLKRPGDPRLAPRPAPPRVGFPLTWFLTALLPSPTPLFEPGLPTGMG